METNADAPTERSADLTSEGVRALAARMVTDELVVVPVRHHSPACALHVRRLIDEHRPAAVLVEGPPAFDELVPLLTHDEAVMPLAVYTWAVAGRGAAAVRSAGYYPFCDYSPELVALRAAAAAGVPARFVDLDYAQMSAIDAAPPDGVSLLQERHLDHSRTLTLLAERIGARDHEDLWEHLFEADAFEVDSPEHLARVTGYCLLARADADQDDLERDGTLAREAAMARLIGEAVAARRPGEGPVLAVLGGFHAVVMPDLVAARAHRPQRERSARRAKPKPTDGQALVRYGFERLERLNGYSSGMTAPAWHQRVWEAHAAGRGGRKAREELALDVLLDVAGRLRDRRRGGAGRSGAEVAVPTPTLAAAHEQLHLLAALRDRPVPLRTDLIDAVTGAFVKGDADTEGARVRRALTDVLVGDRIGAVPPGTGTPPLVVDTLARLRRAKLTIDDTEQRTAALDIYRSPDHRVTSRLLHGVSHLGVPFATRVAGPDFVHGLGLDRLQERWAYAWSPATEGLLAERSMLGSTLPEAVANAYATQLDAFAQSAERRSASSAASLVTQACVLGLHDRVARAVEVASAAVAEDVDFVSVASATTQVASLWESREPLEAKGIEAVPALLRTAFDRAIYCGGELPATGDGLRDAVLALVQLRELLVGAAGADLDDRPYWALVDRLAAEHGSSLVRGGAQGLRYAAGRIDAAGLGRATAGHLAGASDPSDAVGYAQGLLLTARESAWQDTELMPQLDALLGGWDESTFVAHLPDLRLAFADLTPRETDRVAGCSRRCTAWPISAHSGRTPSTRPPSPTTSPSPARSPTCSAPTASATGSGPRDGPRAVAARPRPLRPVTPPARRRRRPDGRRPRLPLRPGVRRARQPRAGLRAGPGRVPRGRTRGLDAAPGHLARRGPRALPRRHRRGRREARARPLRTDRARHRPADPRAPRAQRVAPAHPAHPPRAPRPGRPARRAPGRRRRRRGAQAAPRAGDPRRDGRAPQPAATLTRPDRRELRPPRHDPPQPQELGRRPAAARPAGGALLGAQHPPAAVGGRHLRRPVRSMVDSVIHSAVMAGIMAGLPSFRVRLVVFDTQVVDLTDRVDDPVEVLMSVQLGGGTDIAQALRYCGQVIDNPSRTVLVLITDFCEGGPPAELVRATRALAEARVKLIGLASLDGDANAAHDRAMAGRLADVGMEIAALTPGRLAEWLVEVTS